MGLLEAGFAIWTMDDFIRSNTGSGESHEALQALSGSNLAITTERQREREREGEITFLSLILSGLIWKEKYDLCCSKKSGRKDLLFKTF